MTFFPLNKYLDIPTFPTYIINTQSTNTHTIICSKMCMSDTKKYKGPAI